MYQCKICGKNFLMTQALGGHAVTAHNPELQKKKTLQKMKNHPTHYLELGKGNSHPRGDPTIKLTKDQRELILGSLLGDMAIQRRIPTTNPRLRIRQGSKQAEYTQWKFSMLKNLVRTSPRTSRNGGWGQEITAFSSKSLPCLNEIYHLTTVEGRKKVSRQWLEEITTPQALALWYMDDGSLVKAKGKWKAVHLYCYKFSMEEQSLLQTWLREKWGLESILQKDTRRNGHYLRLNHENSQRFLQLVEPYVLQIPQMKYKTRFMI